VQLGFLKRLIAFRRRHAMLRRARFLHGWITSLDGIKDVTWFSPDGVEKSEQDWIDGWTRSLGLMLAGDAGRDVDRPSTPLADDTLLILLNAHHESVRFVLPTVGDEARWRLEIDTGYPDLAPCAKPAQPAGERWDVPGRTLLIWCLEKDRQEQRTMDA
jgi:glycogen operon protein